MKKDLRHALPIVFALAALLGGCKRSEATSERAHPHSHVHGGDSAALAASAAANTITAVTIESGTSKVTIDLATLPKGSFKGQPSVPLTAVWDAAKLGPMTDLVFDFEGDDGFKPASKDKCPKPMPAADFAKGHMVIASRSLAWDETLGMQHCFAVKLTKRIIAIKG